jgi:acetyl-CoA carboxylase biotin carboxyl carrier protein
MATGPINLESNVGELKLSYEEILQIVKVFESSSQFNELHLKYGEIEIDLRKQGAGPTAAAMQTDRTLAPASQTQAAQPATPAAVSLKSTPDAAAAAAASRSAPALSISPTPAPFAPDASVVRSPMVGTFYCAPEPGATPFVTVGQRVSADSTVCIIEVMKLMNSVQAGVAGVVSQVLVKDGESVEFDQVLIVIDPDT